MVDGDSAKTAPQIAFVHLGCARNLVDAEVMGGILHKAGYHIIDDPDSADVLIVNTCGFIEKAKRESLEAIFSAVQRKKESSFEKPALIVSGCLAQRYPEALFAGIPEIDGLLGIDELERVDEAVRRVLKGDDRFVFCSLAQSLYPAKERFRFTAGHYGYVKISEGCDRRCRFCAIPLIRGGYRSKAADEVIEEINALAKEGAREVVLIGQDTVEYGKDLPGDENLKGLLSRISHAFGNLWIRVLYLHPQGLDKELIELIAERDNLCSYLDVPIQHASERVLRRMGRGEDFQKTRELLVNTRRDYPSVGIRTSLMVGYPGETEEDFERVLAAVEDIRPDYAGIFMFSREEKTPAYSLSEQVSEKVKRRRRNRLNEAVQNAAWEAKQRFVGMQMEVLIDRMESENGAVGRIQGQAPEIDGLTVVQGLPEAGAGDIISVKIIAADAVDLWGDFE